MSSKRKVSIDTKRLFYLTTIVSVLIFIIGNIVTIVCNPSNNSVFGVLSENYLDILTLFVPFSMWAWLIIFGALFVKKIG